MSEAGTAPPAGSTAPDPEVIAQIRRLQRDGLVVIGHLAESHDRRLVAVPGQAGTPPGDLPADLGLLTEPPEAIARQATGFTRLVGTVDQLCRAAMPATPLSIRFTAAYLYGRSGWPERAGNPTGDLTGTELRRARDVRRKLGLLRGLMLAGMLLTVWLLMHVDRGRHILAERTVVQAELTRSYVELAKLERAVAFRVERVPPAPEAAPPVGQPVAPPEMAKARPAAVTLATPGTKAADTPPDNVLPEFCWPPEVGLSLTPKAGLEPGPGGRDGEPPPALAATAPPAWYLPPRTIPAQDLCSGLVQQKTREGLSWTRIAAWNCTQSLMNPLNLAQAVWQWGAARIGSPYRPEAHPCAAEPATLTAPASGTDWARTELRLKDGILSLTGYILPVLLGGIGSAVYVMRRIEQRLRQATLSANDGTAGLGRVLLGATCGGLLGLLFGTDGPVQIGGFSLALGAWALLIGYGLETVLQLLDRLIEATVRTLGGQEKGREVPVASRQSGGAAPAA